MSDNEVESFEVTDYDLDNEFNINRPRGRISKNQRIYGIWADDEDGSDDGEPMVGFKGTGRQPKNYTAPVSFIAGGVQQAGKDKAIKAESSSKSSSSRDSPKRRDSSSEEESPAFSTSKLIDAETAGLRKKRAPTNPTLMNQGIGNWEKHNKGIGGKLMLQMGFQPGKGLGKNLQGIQAPIEAQLRKGRGAIGAYGPEKAAKIAELKTDKSKKGKDGEVEGRVSQWRKEGEEGKKVRYVYKSVDEVLEQSKQPGKPKREFNELSKVKVIDMTGPEQRILSGYHAISGVQRPTDQWEIRKDKQFVNFSVPELQHNLNLLVDMCEQSIIENDKKMRYSEDRIVTIEQEVTKLDKKLVQQESSIESLSKILKTIETFVEAAEKKALTVDQAVASLKQLQESNMSDYQMYEVATLTTTILLPVIKENLKTWEPLEDPEEPLELFKKWRSLVETDKTHYLSAAATQDPFAVLLWESWMPSVRTAIASWNCRNPNPMVEFLEVWVPILPQWILDNILQQTILPKLQLEVENWNPLTDTIPIHVWIHPWIIFLEKHLSTTVFPIIRHKLSVALVNWHPSDTSARLMLEPWSKAFSKGEMDAFLVNNIVPKLNVALQEFIINPHQQHLDNWNWVMDWNKLIPAPIIATILDKCFFPKWLQVLTLWLNMNPDYDQVSRWYSGWKNLVPETLMNEPVVKEHFRSALEMMSRSVGDGGPPSPPPPPSQNTATFNRHQNMAESVRTTSQVPQGFRELVQKRCEEKGILFMPLPNRFKDGKQIYRVGNVMVYIEKNVLFACNNNNFWVPTSLNSLLDQAG